MTMVFLAKGGMTVIPFARPAAQHRVAECGQAQSRGAPLQPRPYRLRDDSQDRLKPVQMPKPAHLSGQGQPDLLVGSKQPAPVEHRDLQFGCVAALLRHFADVLPDGCPASAKTDAARPNTLPVPSIASLQPVVTSRTTGGFGHAQIFFAGNAND